MSYKRSKVNLYDELGVKKLEILQSQVKTTLTVPDTLDVTNKLVLSDRADNADYQSLDVGKDLHDLKTKNTEQDAASGLIAADVSALQGGLADVQADLLSKDGVINQLNISLIGLNTDKDTQNGRLDSIEAVNSTQAGLIAQESTDRAAAVSGLQSQVDALGVTDAATLASINQMLTDYQAADSSFAQQQATQNARLDTIEGVLDTLTL